MEMKKRGLLVIYIFLFVIFIAGFTFAASGRGVLGDAFDTLGSVFGPNLYTKEPLGHGQAIDSILVAIAISIVAVGVYGNKFGNRNIGWVIGSIMGLIFYSGEKAANFYLGDLGKLGLLVGLLVLIGTIYTALRKNKIGGFYTYALFYLIAYWALSIGLGDYTKQIDKNFFGLWTILTAITAIIVFLIIGRIMFFRGGVVGINNLRTPDELFNASSNLVGGAASVISGATRPWFQHRDQEKLTKITSELQQLDRLMQNIQNQQNQLSVDLLKNEQNRLRMITQTEALIRDLNDTNLKFQSKDPNVISQINTLKQRYQEAQTRLNGLIQQLFTDLSASTKLIEQERKLESQDVNLLNIETKKQINDQKRVFKELQDITKNINDPVLKNKESEIERLRSNIAITLNNIRKLVNPQRIKIYATLSQFNRDDINYVNELNKAVLASNYARAIELTRKIRENLGKEISITSADNLKNKDIAGLRAQLQAQHSALNALHNEIEQVLLKSLSLTPRT
ncbi:hypothetical protein HYX18_01820 [Candidatus Woesearchaeota archaeon]|nr:hypothetical protein [Candidatus Woesearchaeota archaeon]